VVSDYYLDSSVALRVLLGHSPKAATWLQGIDADPETRVVSSRLLQTEITRVLRREGLSPTLRQLIMAGVDLVPLTEAVLRSAEGIAKHIKTLDAIHLASALATGMDLVVATHDAQMKVVAEDLGFDTYDPVF
jgi:predicted nucleic acid-binding protein